MRKLILLLLFFTTGTMLVQAQQNAKADTVALKEYTGKYVFPEGSEVAEVKVYLENGLLMASSEQGSTELKRIDKDVFEVVVYTGTATFKRDDKGKVNSVYIEVGNMILDGKKVEEQQSTGK
jgi:hypothetical protein